jgi:hypothetical protein
MSKELMEVRRPTAIMPVMDIGLAAARREAIVEFTKKLMAPGIDYGTIPGTGTKPTLLKPGAEKLTSLFGLEPTFVKEEIELDWTGRDHDGEPFFYFQYRCELRQGETLAGCGLGSCNSWEKKYRYRNAAIVCPNCGKEAVIKGKAEYGGGWLCWAKKDGCGSKWADGDPTIEDQPRGKVPNDNPADLVNTIDKMAQKRALIAATLIAVNASEFFTQDIEDMNFGDIVDAEWRPVDPPSNGKAPGKPEPVIELEQARAKEHAHALGADVDEDIDHLAAMQTADSLKDFAEHAHHVIDGYDNPFAVVGALTQKWPDDHDGQQFVFKAGNISAMVDWLTARKQEAADA